MKLSLDIEVGNSEGTLPFSQFDGDYDFNLFRLGQQRNSAPWTQAHTPRYSLPPTPPHSPLPRQKTAMSQAQPYDLSEEEVFDDNMDFGVQQTGYDEHFNEAESGEASFRTQRDILGGVRRGGAGARTGQE